MESPNDKLFARGESRLDYLSIHINMKRHTLLRGSWNFYEQADVYLASSGCPRQNGCP
jgi:hypothetical protein